MSSHAFGPVGTAIIVSVSIGLMGSALFGVGVWSTVSVLGASETTLEGVSTIALLFETTSFSRPAIEAS